MEIYKVTVKNPSEIFTVRDEDEHGAIFQVRAVIDLPEVSRADIGNPNTPKPLDDNIKECELDFTSGFPRSGKKEILERKSITSSK